MTTIPSSYASRRFNQSNEKKRNRFSCIWFRPIVQSDGSATGDTTRNGLDFSIHRWWSKDQFSLSHSWVTERTRDTQKEREREREGVAGEGVGWQNVKWKASRNAYTNKLRVTAFLLVAGIVCILSVGCSAFCRSLDHTARSTGSYLHSWTRMAQLLKATRGGWCASPSDGCVCLLFNFGSAQSSKVWNRSTYGGTLWRREDVL